MNSFLDTFLSLIPGTRSTKRSTPIKRKQRRGLLNVECLEERCVPSANPFAVDSNHNLLYGSAIVEPSIEAFQWASSTNVGYALQQGGALESFTAAKPTAGKSMGSGYESIALGSTGTIFALTLGGTLESSTNSGSSWTNLDASLKASTQAFAMGASGTLFNLLTGGLLVSSTNSGVSWSSNLDANAALGPNAITESFAVSPKGTLYNLLTNGILYSSSNSGASWSNLDATSGGLATQSFAVDAKGNLYNLLAGGLLEYSSNSGTSWITLDPATQAFAVSSTGTLYDLADSPGELWSTTDLGITWNLLDNNTQSFAVDTNGTLYNLLTGGTLEYSTNSGASWTTLDPATQAFAVSGNGTLYDFADSPGALWSLTNPSLGWNLLDTTTQSFTVGSNGTLYNLLTGGTLEFSINSGSSWTTLDPATQAFAVTGNGTLHALADSPGELWSTTNLGVGWNLLDNTTQSFTIGTNGTLYNLLTGGTLEYSTNSGASWTSLDPASQAFAVSGNGTIYDLADAPGELWSTTDLGVGWSLLDTTTQSFAIGVNGALYNLLTDGTLEYSTDFDTSWGTLDTATQAFAVSGNGTLYDLADSPGELWITVDLGNDWSLLDNNTQSFSVGSDGALYNQLTSGMLEYSADFFGKWSTLDSTTQAFAVSGNGTLYNQLTSGVLENSTNLGSSWTTIDRLVTSFSLTSNGTLTETDWFDTLQDPALAALARTDYTRDNAITRVDFIGLLNTVIKSGPNVTAAQMNSLQTLVDDGAGADPTLIMPVDVNNLASKLVNGNPANAVYQNTPLGNIAPNGTTAQLGLLEKKWFYGDDTPQADGSYHTPGGTLFGSSGVPSYHDIAQGDVADCYFLTALGQLALQAPSAIENMFVNNGDGTYTVRFYDNDQPDYVTINSLLPESSTGNFVYAGYDQYGKSSSFTNSGNVLWVALAEKAYAQLAAEGWSRDESPEQSNAYLSLNRGNQLQITVWEQVIGTASYTHYYPTGSSTPSSMEPNIVKAMEQNDLLAIYTLPTFPSNSTVTNPGFDEGHCYILESYNVSTGEFIFVNPYDDGNGPRFVYATSWAQVETYVDTIEDLTPPAGLEVSTIVGNPNP